MKISKGTLFIVSAPSGCGKTTLVEAVVQDLSSQYDLERVITYTTKKPRAEEIPEVSYHFIGRQDFEKKIQEGFFLEWSRAYIEYYGSPSSIIEGLQKGTSYIMILDLTGACSLRSILPCAQMIWICPPSIDSLECRLRLRGSDKPEEIKRRLLLAQQEISQESALKVFDFRIINESFAQAKEELKNIILSKVSSRRNY
jgi:guanylate kinase